MNKNNSQRKYKCLYITHTNNYRMDYNQERVKIFMNTFEQECPTKPTIAAEKIRILRAKLILEETVEFIDALGLRLSWKKNNVILKQVKEPDLVKIADAIADLEVINKGSAVAFGIDSEKFFNLVMDNNMTKLVNGKPLKRADGKILKPDGYKPVTEEIKKLLEKEMNQKS